MLYAPLGYGDLSLSLFFFLYILFIYIYKVHIYVNFFIYGVYIYIYTIWTFWNPKSFIHRITSDLRILGKVFFSHLQRTLINFAKWYIFYLYIFIVVQLQSFFPIALPYPSSPTPTVNPPIVCAHESSIREIW